MPEAAKRRLVSCGRSWLGQELAVVVGEIRIAGPSIAGGYWNRPEETAATFGATLPGLDGETWLRTGDLGFLAGGELFVTGRAKELIILRGRNLYLQGVERTAEASHPGLRRSGISPCSMLRILSFPPCLPCRIRSPHGEHPLRRGDLKWLTM